MKRLLTHPKLAQIAASFILILALTTSLLAGITGNTPFNTTPQLAHGVELAPTIRTITQPEQWSDGDTISNGLTISGPATGDPLFITITGEVTVKNIITVSGKVVLAGVGDNAKLKQGADRTASMSILRTSGGTATVKGECELQNLVVDGGNFNGVYPAFLIGANNILTLSNTSVINLKNTQTTDSNNFGILNIAGELIMRGGEISHNTSSGTIMLRNNATPTNVFTMYGGTIADNTLVPAGTALAGDIVTYNTGTTINILPEANLNIADAITPRSIAGNMSDDWNTLHINLNPQAGHTISEVIAGGSVIAPSDSGAYAIPRNPVGLSVATAGDAVFSTRPVPPLPAPNSSQVPMFIHPYYNPIWQDGAATIANVIISGTTDPANPLVVQVAGTVTLKHYIRAVGCVKFVNANGTSATLQRDTGYAGSLLSTTAIGTNVTFEHITIDGNNVNATAAALQIGGTTFAALTLGAGTVIKNCVQTSTAFTGAGAVINFNSGGDLFIQPGAQIINNKSVSVINLSRYHAKLTMLGGNISNNTNSNTANPVQAVLMVADPNQLNDNAPVNIMPNAPVTLEGGISAYRSSPAPTGIGNYTKVTVNVVPLNAPGGFVISAVSANGTPVQPEPATGIYTLPAITAGLSVTGSGAAATVHTVSFASDSVVAGSATGRPGTLTSSQIVADGGLATAPATEPAQTARYFGGWRVSPDGGASIATAADEEFDWSTPITSSIVLAAYLSTTPITYPITSPGPTAGGTVTTNVAAQQANTSVTLTISPVSGYKIDTLSVMHNGTALTLTGSGNTRYFVMPRGPVTISASFVLIDPSILYDITLPTNLVGGSVLSDKATALAGETVTITVTPEADYDLKTLTYQVAGQTAQTITGTGGTYSFVMPYDNVTLAAKFGVQDGANGIFFYALDVNSVSRTGSWQSYVNLSQTKAVFGDTITLTILDSKYIPNGLSFGIQAYDKLTGARVYGIANLAWQVVDATTVSFVVPLSAYDYGIVLSMRELFTVTKVQPANGTIGDLYANGYLQYTEGGWKTYENDYTHTQPAGGSLLAETTPAEGYKLDTIIVTKDSDGSPVAVTDKVVFTMPAEPVTITAQFSPIPPATWLGTNSSVTNYGSGTVSDPWLITNLADFLALAEVVNLGSNVYAPDLDSSSPYGYSFDGYKGSYFKLTADLTMPAISSGSESSDWRAVGHVNLRPFRGTFDGNFHTVDLQINDTVATNPYNHPHSLFGFLDGATIMHLTTTGSKITWGAGGIIAAGMIGGSSIFQCANYVDITGVGGAGFGALVGGGGYGGQQFYAFGDTTALNYVSQSVNHGNIKSHKSGATAISGHSYNFYTRVTDCYNFGLVDDFAGAYFTVDAGYTGLPRGSLYPLMSSSGVWQLVSADTLKTAAAALNGTRTGDDAPWREDYAGTQSISNGFPILKWQLPNTALRYNITVASSIANGTVAVDQGLVDSNANKTIKLNVAPAANYKLVELKYNSTVIDLDLKNILGADTYEFTMPAEDVEISAVFEALPIAVSSVVIEPLGGASAVISQPNGTLAFRAGVSPTNATNSAVAWSITSGSAFASISASGVLTAQYDGTVTVRATAQDGSGAYGTLSVSITGQPGVPAGYYSITTGQTGAGSIALQGGRASLNALPGDSVEFTVNPAAGQYLAQIRTSVNGGAAYSALDLAQFTSVGSSGITYSLAVPASALDIQVDFISIVWDGAIDLTWYDPAASSYSLQYPAQFAGAAAINNGLFTTYPTVSTQMTNGVWADLPNYAAFQAGMGVNGAASHLYGEFSATYKVSDSQSGYARSGNITKTTRIVGNPAFIVTSQGNGATGENNETTTDDFYYGAEDYRGKTIHITADLNFGGLLSGGRYSTASPLFMSLGGQYAMLPGGDKTNAYAKIGSSFNGTLDGGGHKFEHVYAEYFANTAYGDSSTLGIVGRLGVHDADPASKLAVNPTVRNIVLDSGLVSARRSVGGIVGKIGKTTGTTVVHTVGSTYDGSLGGVIEYAINKATIRGTDKKGTGGIVGSAWNGGLVQYCANLGPVSNVPATGGAAAPTGGIVGTSEVLVKNCYNVGQVTALSANFAQAIGTGNGGSYPFENVYWLTGTASNGGTFNALSNATVYEFGPGKAISTLTAAQLNVGTGNNSIWLNPTASLDLNNGYPMLFFQGGASSGANFDITLTQPAAHGIIKATTASGTADNNNLVVSGSLSEMVSLSAEIDPGYVLSHYVVNGTVNIAGNFSLFGPTTVSAVLRPVTELTATFADTATHTLTVSKEGIVKSGSVFTATSGPVAVNTGEQVFEGDVLTITASLIAGVVPSDAEKSYSGQFSYSTVIGSNAALSQNPLALTKDRVVGNTTLTITATPQIIEKNWGELANTAWYDSNTSAASYIISTPEQLAGIAKLVNSGVSNFAGKTIVLANDISLGTADSRVWVPIGIAGAGNAFAGTFDGDGKSITGLLITGNSGNANLGLFGTAEGATIQKVTVAGSVTGGVSVAGVVGYAKNSTVRNITNEVAVSVSVGLTSANNIAGVVGWADAGTVITGVINQAVISGNDTSSRVGGIVGNAGSATIASSINYGDVSGGYNVGGIAGQSANTPIGDVLNAGDITSTSTEVISSSAGVGGIVGTATGNNASTTAITSAHNSGQVSSAGTGNETAVGGVAGVVSNVALSGHLNIGDITVSSGASGLKGRIVGSGADQYNTRLNVVLEEQLIETVFALLPNVVVSVDGTELAGDQKWATQTDLDALYSAITEAKKVRDNSTAKQSQVNAALQALDTAREKVQFGQDSTAPITANPRELLTLSVVDLNADTFVGGQPVKQSGSVYDRSQATHAVVLHIQGAYDQAVKVYTVNATSGAKTLLTSGVDYTTEPGSTIINLATAHLLTLPANASQKYSVEFTDTPDVVLTQLYVIDTIATAKAETPATPQIPAPPATESLAETTAANGRGSNNGYANAGNSGVTDVVDEPVASPAGKELSPAPATQPSDMSVQSGPDWVSIGITALIVLLLMGATGFVMYIRRKDKAELG